MPKTPDAYPDLYICCLANLLFVYQETSFQESKEIGMQYVHGPRRLICIYDTGYVDFARPFRR